MTGLEKSIAVKNLVREACSCSACVDCQFFNPEDETDGNYWCFLRDAEGRIPYRHDWHMESAMLNS